MIRRHVVRRGLTLMELVVVMTILIALASILIPILPGMLNRAHTSTGATNVSELNKAIQTHEQMYMSYPDQFDALIDEGGTGVCDYIFGIGNGELAPYPLTAGDVDALTAAGITNLAAMHDQRTEIPADQDPTFNPYTGAFIPVAATNTLVRVSEAAVEAKFAREVDPLSTQGDVYLIFGVGTSSTMIGKTIAQPPIHFPDNNSISPSNVYSRFGVVFRTQRGTPSGTPSPLGRAVFIGVVEFHEDGIATADDHIGEYYDSVRAAQ